LRSKTGHKQREHVFEVSSEGAFVLASAAASCDAFVCANDRIAGRLMHHLRQRGIRIPEDVRIVGIDDVVYASLLPVPLTTVHQPCRDIGEIALRLMLERLERPDMPARQVLLDCSLVIRESCGAERDGDEEKE
jgi:DNA-binding LacI/PurR family transcriptional regulator